MTTKRSRDAHARAIPSISAITILLVAAAIVLRVSPIAAGLQVFRAGALIRVYFLAAVSLSLVGYLLLRPAFIARLGTAIGRVLAKRPLGAVFIWLTSVGLIIGTARGNASIAEDTVLVVWFLTAAAVGSAIGLFGGDLVRQLQFVAVVLALLGLLEAIGNVGFPPLYAASIPSLAFISLGPSGFPSFARLAAIAVLMVLVVQAFDQEKLSTIGQVSAAILLIGVFWLSSIDSRLAFPVVGIAVVVLIFAASLPNQLPIGITTSVGVASTDASRRARCSVCLDERTFEAAKVRDELSSDPLSTLFGVGLGASLDLSDAPDVSTLSASGRNLSAVDDVHLLLYNIAWKWGILGLGTLSLWIVSVAVGLWRLIKIRSHSSPGALLVLLILAAWVVESIGAATHLFWNPIGGVMFGVAQGLLARPCESGDETTPGSPGARLRRRNGRFQSTQQSNLD